MVILRLCLQQLCLQNLCLPHRRPRNLTRRFSPRSGRGYRLWLPALMTAIVLGGCERSTEPAASMAADPTAATAVIDAGLASATQHAWTTAVAMQQSVQPQVAALQRELTAFSQTPDEAGLQQARHHWHRVHQQLQRVQPLFALGAVAPQPFAALQESRAQLDAWPIEPGYIDYVDVYPYSGLVNDFGIPLNETSVRSQHGFSSDTEVVLGMHAIAYLLWGEHGQRPATDFTPTQPTTQQRQEGLQSADLPNQRRLALLSLQASLLRQDMDLLGHRLLQSQLPNLYAQLPAPTQLQLWRQALLHLLSRELERPLAQRRLPPGDEMETPHNHSAGGHGQLMAATLAGLQQLLLSHRDDHQPLAYWLNPESDLRELATGLQDLLAAVTAADSHWDELTAEQIQVLLDQLQPIRDWLAAEYPAAQP